MWIYIFILNIVALFNDKVRLLVRGERTTLKRLATEIDKSSKYVWFHAASVGEFEQARPVIEKLRAEQPEKKILLTFFSPSGYELRKDYKNADIVAYLPFATRHNARRFLDIVNPETAIFVKYEFWPAYLKELKKRNIPTYIFSAIFRPNQLFFKWYGKAYRNLLYLFNTLLVQNDESKQLLEKYGIQNSIVAGDTRFDRVIEVVAHSKKDALIEAFINSPTADKVIIAGSTWQPDEELLVKYFVSHPNVKLLLVPHEINHSHLEKIRSLLGEQTVFYTESTIDSIKSSRCLVLDKVGMLSSIYGYATVAYIGGGFGVGIHNTLEAAVYGLPVVFGPHYNKFKEACDLIACGGGYSINNYDELSKIFDQLIAEPTASGQASAKYVTSHKGAVDKVYNTIFSNTK